MSFVIEKNVPLPEKGGNSGLADTLRQLVPGDSFFCSESKISSISNQVTQFKNANGGQFTCRSLDGGVRIWRLS